MRVLKLYKIMKSGDLKIMFDKRKIQIIEALTQNVVGLLVAFVVMRLYGLPLTHTLALQGIFFILSVVRSYLIRLYFSRYD